MNKPLEQLDFRLQYAHINECFLQALYQNDKFTEEQMHNYRMAVTER